MKKEEKQRRIALLPDAVRVAALAAVPAAGAAGYPKLVDFLLTNCSSALAAGAARRAAVR